MWRTLAAILAVVAVAPALAQEQTTDETLFERSQSAIERGDGPLTRALLREHAKLYPESPHAPTVLLQLARTFRDDDSEEKRAALQVLGRLHKSFPESEEARESVPLVERLEGASFARAPESILAEHQALWHEASKWQGADEFEVLRVPSALYRAAVDAAPVGTAQDLLGLVHSIPRDRFKREKEGIRSCTRENSLEWARGGFAPVVSAGILVVREKQNGFEERHVVRVQTFGLDVRVLQGRALVRAADLWTGDPVANLDVTVRTLKTRFTVKTDAQGVATFDLVGHAILVAARGDDVEAVPVFAPGPEHEERVFITTDRPVYRPGQTVFFKAVRRDLHDGKLTLRTGDKVRVEVQDPEHRLLQSQELAWNEQGALSGSFKLGDEPPLGEWQVVVQVERVRRSDWDERWWQKGFQVAAYRKPEMKATVTVTGNGQKLMAKVHADYFFGAPVADAFVHWEARRGYASRRVSSTRPRPDPQDPRQWFYDRRVKDENDFGYGDEFASGEGKTNADGDLEVPLTPPPTAEGEEGYAREYSVTATVRDLSRLEVEATGSLEASGSALRVSVFTPELFYAQGSTAKPCVRVTTTDGKPVAGREVELVAFASGWTPSGERELESFFSARVKTDARGVATAEVPLARSGSARIRARVTEGASEAEDRVDVLVAGEACSKLPDVAIDSPIQADRLLYDEGDTARILVLSPGKMTALLTVEGGSMLEARSIRLEKRCEIVAVPLAASFAPNVVIKVTGCKEGNVVGGGVEVFVFPKARYLDVAVSTDKPSYGPRQKAKVSVATSVGANGVPAEVELAIVDESIFSVKADETKDIRNFFAPIRVMRHESAGTFPAPELGLSTLSLAPRFSGRGGLAGATLTFAAEDKPTIAFAPAETRRFFPDTLHYSAHVKTDPDGKAEVEVETPDSLTTWRIVARAVSNDRVGEARTSTLTKKDVTLRLVAPRFFTERDEGLLATIVHSELPDEIEVAVRLRYEGAEGESGERRITLRPGEAKRVDWKIRLNDAGTLKVHAEALSRVESDAVEVEVPVHAHGIERQAATAARVEGTWHGTLTLPEGVAARGASLEVVATQGGLAAVAEALPFLAGYPYGCVEQTMSRFLPSVTASRAMHRLGLKNPLDERLPDMVSQGLQRLYAYQHDDGGWGWWTHDETNPWMTAYVVYGLSQARSAGFAVDASTLERGLVKLREFPLTAFGLYARAVAGDDVHELLTEVEPRDAEETAYLVLAGRRELARQLPGAVPVKSGPDEIRTTALVVRALAASDPHDARIAPLVEWFLSVRRGGAWVSTLDTACVVYALTDTATVEKAPGVEIRVNGSEVSSRLGRVSVPASLLRSGENEVEVRASGGVVHVSAVLHWVAREETGTPERGALAVTRRFERRYRAGDDGTAWEHLESGSEVQVGEELRVTLTVRAPRDPVAYVMVDSPLAAGTEARETDDGGWYRRELRDDRVCAPIETVDGTETTIVYSLRPTTPGVYHVLPAVAWSMYDPEKRGTSGELLLRVVDRK